MRANAHHSQLVQAVILIFSIELFVTVCVLELTALKIFPLVAVPPLMLLEVLYFLRFTPASPYTSQSGRMRHSWSAITLGVLVLLVVADGFRLLLKNIVLGDTLWQSLSWQATGPIYLLAFAIGCCVVKLIRPYFALRDIPGTAAAFYLSTFSKQFRFR